MGAMQSKRSCLILITLLISTVTYAMENSNESTQPLLPGQIMRQMFCISAKILVKQPSTQARQNGHALILKKSLTYEELDNETYEKLPLSLQKKVKEMPKISSHNKKIYTDDIMKSTRVIEEYDQSSSPHSPSNSSLNLNHRSRASSNTSETSESSTPTLSQSKLSMEYASFNPQQETMSQSKSTQYISLNPEGGLSDDEGSTNENEIKDIENGWEEI